MGLFDRICSAESMMKFPALYKASQNAELFNAKVLYCKNVYIGQIKANHRFTKSQKQSIKTTFTPMGKDLR